MVKRKAGKILNVASVVAFQPGPTMATYFATKAFVLSLSQALSHEWQKYGVQVMALCPGVTASGFQESSNQVDKIFTKAKNIPTSKQVAQFGFDQLAKGKSLAIHGFLNNVICILHRIMPRKVLLKIIENTLK
jgi:short-subunit dehydrogenase